LKIRFLLLLIATAIVLVASAAAQAQTPQTTISVGGASAKLGDKVVVLPAPEGYEEAATQWETVKSAFVAMVPPEGDLLAAYLQVSDCELIRKGQPPLMPSWLMINIYREARTHVSSKEEFGRIVAYARQNTESIIDPQKNDMKEQFARIDEFLSKEYSKDVKMDLSKPKILGEFNNRPNVYSNLLLMKLNLQMDGKAVDHPPMLATMSLVLVQERIITVLTYKKLESKADAEALTQLTTKWINQILAAN
jgi:hypothetical protein